MAAEPDYYAVLGVSSDSEDVVIQAAYRALMRRYHPDTNSSAEAARKAVQINAAYAVLNDSDARAAYDARRRSQANPNQNGSHNSTPPPPPPPPRQSGNTASPPPKNATNARGASGGLIFATILTLVIVVAAISSGSGTSGENVMNVDENLTTTDMNATDMNAMTVDENLTTSDMNETIDSNETDAVPPDLSKQPQTALSYDTIEDAAKQLAKIITTKGISGARAYSESCHKAVEAAPSWDGADDCAAFDYAAAYIDDAVSTQGNWPKNGYFEFQSSNESDDYAAAGAPSYVMSDRLNKIRAAAQTAAAEAFRYEVARIKAKEVSQSEPSTQAVTANSNE